MSSLYISNKRNTDMPTINWKHGDILDEYVQVLVNPVNTIGVMGAGLALQFKQKFPDMYEYYKEICSAGIFLEGQNLTYDTKWEDRHITILNVATKGHWRDKSNLAIIDKCITNIYEYIADNNIESIAIPALGCGLGGLKWPSVRVMFVDKLDMFDKWQKCTINIFLPYEFS